jgi:photosystem II PsbY protein
MDFDFRLLIMLLPLLAAAGWAGYTIWPMALKQIQGLGKK